MTRFQRERMGWGVLLGVPALFIAAFVVSSFHTLQQLPLCAVKSFLKIDCPGCGLTRSFAALVQGHIRASIDFHPLGIVIALWLLYMWGRSLIISCGRDCPTLLTQTQRDWMLRIFLAAMLFQWMVHVVIGT